MADVLYSSKSLATKGTKNYFQHHESLWAEVTVDGNKSIKPLLMPQPSFTGLCDNNKSAHFGEDLSSKPCSQVITNMGDALNTFLSPKYIYDQAYLIGSNN